MADAEGPKARRRTPEPAWKQGLSTPLFTLDMPVRWGDMDALGHVNNATYLTYFEQARVAWLESLQAGQRIGQGSNTGPVIVNASLEFHEPIVYPARLTVNLYAGDPGRSSFQTWSEIHDSRQPERHYASCVARVVWVDHAAGRSVALPPELRARLPDTRTAH